MSGERGRQVAPNLLMGVLSFLSNIAFALWFTPFLIESVGAVAYGYLPLATMMVSYASILTLSLETSLNRQLAQSLAEGDAARGSQHYREGRRGALLVAAVLLALLVALLAGLDRLLVVDGVPLSDVQALFAFVGGAFLCQTLALPLRAVVYAHERLDWLHGINLVGVLAKWLLVIGLYRQPEIGIWGAGAALAMVHLIEGVMAWAGKRKLEPGLGRRKPDEALRSVSELWRTSAWVGVSQLAHLLFIAVDLVVINRLLGEFETARYAVVLQWAALVAAFATTLSGVFGPTLLADLGAGRIKEAGAFSRHAVRFVGLTMAVATGLLVGFREEILTLWLDESWRTLGDVTLILLLPLGLSLCVLTLESVTLGAGRVRFPALFALGLGALRLLGVVWVARNGLGAEGEVLKSIAAVAAIALILRYPLFLPFYASRILSVSPWGYLRSLGAVAGVQLSVFLFSGWVAATWTPHSWLALAIWVSVVGGGACLAIWLLVLSRGERAYLLTRFGRGRAVALK